MHGVIYRETRRGGSRLAVALHRSFSYLRDQRGLASLAELLVVIGLLTPVLATVFLLYGTAVKQQARAESRVHTQIDQTIAFQRITRDLRQATKFFPQADGYSVDFNAVVKQADNAPLERHIRYECTPYAWGDKGSPAKYGECVRKEGSAGSSTFDEQVTLIKHMRNLLWDNSTPPNYDFQSNFTPTPNTGCPSTVAVKLTIDVKNELRQLTPDPATPLVLEDSVVPRNPCSP